MKKITHEAGRWDCFDCIHGPGDGGREFEFDALNGIQRKAWLRLAKNLNASEAKEEKRGDDAEEALREIMMLIGCGDPSDGEGTSPEEVVEYVKQFIAGGILEGGAQMIALERDRQVKVEEWDAKHDDEHRKGELASAGACYAALAANQSRVHMDFKPSEIYPPKLPNLTWPWDEKWWKPSNDPIRNLVKAGALIAAEIDRLRRKEVGPNHAPAD